MVKKFTIRRHFTQYTLIVIAEANYSTVKCYSQPSFYLLATMSGDSTGALFNVVSYVGDGNADGISEIIVGDHKSYCMNGPGKVYNYSFDKPDGVYRNNEIKLPRHFQLYQNYPNSFNPSTEISYQLPTSSIVTLTIYDILGREVKNLVNEKMDAGFHTVTWNAIGFLSGVYIARINTGNFVTTKKLMLLK